MATSLLALALPPVVANAQSQTPQKIIAEPWLRVASPEEKQRQQARREAAAQEAEKQRQQRFTDNKPRLSDCTDKECTPEQKAMVSKASKNYILELRKKYASRIIYEDAYARKIAQDFDIDCKARDGRYLPLENVLLATISAHDELLTKGKNSSNNSFTIRVVSRGDDVRVYDEAVIGGDHISMVRFEINKWGEIRSPTHKLEATRNSCFGSYGPIWVVPGN